MVKISAISITIGKVKHFTVDKHPSQKIWGVCIEIKFIPSSVGFEICLVFVVLMAKRYKLTRTLQGTNHGGLHILRVFCGQFFPTVTGSNSL